jgi:hypothetical protein
VASTTYAVSDTFLLGLLREETMGLSYLHLDELSRPHMLSELRADVHSGTLYRSPRLTEVGACEWASLLEEAISGHTDDWLASELQRRSFIRTHEERRKPKGGFTLAQVPVNAHETLGEGEFNRFYVRGLCLRAIADGVVQVIAYRARHSANPRAESEAIIGKVFSPAALLADLRISQGVEPALGVPPGPNSGLSIKLQ